MNNEQAAEILQDIFQHAVNSARAGPVTLVNLPEKPRGRCVVIGAGKASAAMAAAVDAAWSDVAVSGVVVTRYGYAVPAGRIRIIEAAHPVSDAMSEVAAMLIVETLRGLTADDLVLALISGGGSALMALPAPGLTLADKQTITRALLHSGASIKEMNLVRRHLSAVKGGKLATMAQPARIVSLIISDVPGDDPTDVASGPTVADNSAPRDALRVLQRYGIAIPKPVSERLNQPAGPVENAATGEVRLIATPAMALAAAALAARQHGFTPLILGDAIEGESREVAVVMAGMGGETIIHILTDSPWPRDSGCTLLLQPQTKVELLRRWISENGYVCRDERLVWDKGKLYVVLQMTAGEPFTPDEVRLYGGLHLEGDPLYGDYLDAQLQRLRRRLDGLRHSREGADCGTLPQLIAVLEKKKEALK